MATDRDDRLPDLGAPPQGESRAAVHAVEATDAEARRHAPSRPRAFDLHAFLGRAETQARLRAVVVRRLRGAPAPLVDEVVQAANLAALKAKSPPRAAETASGWLATVAVRAVIDRIRKNASERRWLDPAPDVDELSDETAAATEEAASNPWLVSTWLARVVGSSERDQETPELLCYKARGGKTYEEVAADHGTTVASLKSRFHEFKKRYARQWRRRQMMFVFVFGGGVAVVAIVVYVVAQLLRPVPPPPPPAPAAVPSASAPPDTTFEPAAPTPRRIENQSKPRSP